MIFFQVTSGLNAQDEKQPEEKEPSWGITWVKVPSCTRITKINDCMRRFSAAGKWHMMSLEYYRIRNERLKQ